MSHGGHLVLVMLGASILLGGGLIILGLAWRRKVLGQSSGVDYEGQTARRTMAGIAAVPTVGIIVVVVGLLIARAVPGVPPN